MSTYFIATWNTQLSGAARKRAEVAIHAIDPTADLVCVDIPGNLVHMWLERPNDGSNNYDFARLRNSRCIAAVEAEGKRRQT